MTKDDERRFEEIEHAIAQLAQGLQQTVAWVPAKQGQTTLDTVIQRARKRHAAGNLETRPDASARETRA